MKEKHSHKTTITTIIMVIANAPDSELSILSSSVIFIFHYIYFSMLLFNYKSNCITMLCFVLLIIYVTFVKINYFK